MRFHYSCENIVKKVIHENQSIIKFQFSSGRNEEGKKVFIQGVDYLNKTLRKCVIKSDYEKVAKELNKKLKESEKKL